MSPERRADLQELQAWVDELGPLVDEAAADPDLSHPAALQIARMCGCVVQKLETLLGRSEAQGADREYLDQLQLLLRAARRASAQAEQTAQGLPALH